MAFVEHNSDQPVRHNPYLHEIVLKELEPEARGDVLDLPSGPGYLVRDLTLKGFRGIAAEIDDRLHVFPEIQYRSVDMTRPFPFTDSSFDYVTSVEGIEHIENHLAFLREVSRVLRKDGQLVLTTPNILSLASRWNFFLSGFHSMAAKPIPLDTENIYFEHINPIALNQLYFYCERVGLRIERITTHRHKSGSRFWRWTLGLFIQLGIYRACFWKEKDPKRREENRRLYKLLSSKDCLLGTHLIIVARKL